jgi:peptide/nickel transport system substrate-binding protein
VTAKRKGLAAASVLTGIALIAGACGSSSKTATTTGGASTTTQAATTTAFKPAGGTITVALADVFGAGNSLTADDSLFSNTIVMNAVLPSPYIFNNKAELVQDKNVLDSAEITSKSPQVVTWHLNKKAVWSDGVPIDCSDFVLAWVSENGKLTAKDAKGVDQPLFSAASTTGYEQISKIDCTDPTTPVTTFDTPFADWQGLFGLLLPAHAVAKVAGVADIAKAYDAKDMPGLTKVAEVWNNGYKTDKGPNKDLFLSGGPYSVSASDYEKSVTLTRNDKYWGRPGQADSIVFNIIKEDTTSVQALQNGDVQLVQPQPDPDLLKTLQGAKGVKSEVDGGYTFEHLDLNLATPIFKDIAVRQAVQLCFPREDIVTKLIKPVAPDAVILNNRLFIPAQSAYEDNSNGFKTDIAKAKSTLEAAGYALGSDGIYAKGGVKLEFKLLHKKNARRSNEEQLMAASCKQAGINVIDDGDDKWSSRAGKSQYDAAIFAWTGSPLLSSQKALYVTGGGQNWNGYSNKDLDALFETISTSLDPAAVVDAAKKVDKILWTDAVTIPIFQFPDLLAYSDKLSNVLYNPTTSGWTWNVQDWVLAK